MANISVKTASPFDLDQISDLLQYGEESTQETCPDIDTLYEALWGNSRAVKAIVARQVMMVVGCSFYQVTFSVPNNCYLIHEVSYYIHPRHRQSGVKHKLREKLESLNIKQDKQQSIIKTLSDQEKVSL